MPLFELISSRFPVRRPPLWCLLRAFGEGIGLGLFLFRFVRLGLLRALGWRSLVSVCCSDRLGVGSPRLQPSLALGSVVGPAGFGLGVSFFSVPLRLGTLVAGGSAFC